MSGNPSLESSLFILKAVLEQEVTLAPGARKRKATFLPEDLWRNVRTWPLRLDVGLSLAKNERVRGTLNT